jgi:uncharacterized coiled-coil protein SlyX
MKDEKLAEAFIRKHALKRFEHVEMKCEQKVYSAVNAAIAAAGWTIYQGPRKNLGYYIFKMKRPIGGITSQEKLLAELNDLMNQITKATEEREKNAAKVDELTQKLQRLRAACKHNDDGDGKCKNCGHVLYVKDCVNAT